MPFARTPGSLAAKTTTTSAASAFATQTLRPSRRNPPRSGRAVVAWFAASDPACASDSANAPIAAPDASGRSHRSTCVSDPNWSSGSATSELLTVRITASVALACAIASTASA
jgi:hypothetical protein